MNIDATNQIFYAACIAGVVALSNALLIGLSTVIYKLFIEARLAIWASKKLDGFKDGLLTNQKKIDLEINELREINKSVRESAISRWSKRDELLFQAMKESAELVWVSYTDMTKYHFLAEIVAIISWDAIKESQRSNPEKMAEFAKTLLGDFKSPKSLVFKSIECSALYLSDEILYLRQLKMSIVSNAFLKVQSLALGIEADQALKVEEYKKLALKALPSNSDYINSLDLDKYNYLIKPCDLRIQYLLRSLLSPQFKDSDLSANIIAENLLDTESVRKTQLLNKIEEMGLSNK